MTHVWRIVKAKYADEAFTGEGARRAGGRFNSPGVSVVYTSESLALAQLEMLVHLPTDRLLSTYVAFQVEVPDAYISTLAKTDLPDNWRASPVPLAVQMIGDQWIADGKSVALCVPSAVVPLEHNILLNPAHADFSDLTIHESIDPEIDERIAQ